MKTNSVVMPKVNQSIERKRGGGVASTGTATALPGADAFDSAGLASAPALLAGDFFELLLMISFSLWHQAVRIEERRRSC